MKLPADSAGTSTGINAPKPSTGEPGGPANDATGNPASGTTSSASDTSHGIKTDHRPKAGSASTGTAASIGASIKISGDLSGKEDLTIDGDVEGTVDFRDNSVRVGPDGCVRANVIAKNISVAGQVTGDLHGSEHITIEPSGRVVGNIQAPKVVLREGCQFKGNVDMEEVAIPTPETRSPPSKLTTPKPFLRRPVPAPAPTNSAPSKI